MSSFRFLRLPCVFSSPLPPPLPSPVSLQIKSLCALVASNVFSFRVCCLTAVCAYVSGSSEDSPRRTREGAPLFPPRASDKKSQGKTQIQRHSLRGGGLHRRPHPSHHHLCSFAHQVVSWYIAVVEARVSTAWVGL